MTLPVPNLDDRDFEDLLEQARRRIVQLSPDWNDLSPSDPGMVLVELFAFLTESMIYRLNRFPDKAFIAFLNLIGVRLMPPGAASVMLTFKRKSAGETALEIPRGTRVIAARATRGGAPPVFATADGASIPPGEKEVAVLAHHCDLVIAEEIGTGNGMAGLTAKVRRPPIVASTSHPLDLIIGVRAEADELDERSAAIEDNGIPYRIWREVETFSNVEDDPYVFIADRVAGTVTFAPAVRSRSQEGGLTEVPEALAAIPQAGREILAWYRSGGGPDGNVAAGTLTTMKDPIPGVEVTNLSPATGGRPGESLDNALLRGPQELHSLERAVTARDFQLVALRSSGAVARARAFTKADLWRHALPGTVQLLLVPYLPSESRTGGALTVSQLKEYETESALTEVVSALSGRRPAATIVETQWAHYKTVSVKARIVVHREEDLDAVHRRVLARLHGTVNPLPTEMNPRGWRFGEALRASNVYDMVLAEAGVRYVDRVRLIVDEVPDKGVLALDSDQFQPATWYAGSTTALFRSLNDGEGWEVCHRFPGETIDAVKCHPDIPGLVAVASRLSDESSHLQISRDSGESWEPPVQLERIEDLAWTTRGSTPVLMMATHRGLYELSVEPGATPLQVVVDPSNPNLGFYSAVVATDPSGVVSVALAARDTGGIYLSTAGGRSDSFGSIGLVGEDVRVLAVQHDGPRSFLWAGTAGVGADDPGKGCYSWELRGEDKPPEGWRPRQLRWRGGSCWALAFLGSSVFAATHSGGVLLMDPSTADPEWEASDVRCGLPMRDPGRFHPVQALASDPSGQKLLAGGPEGVARSDDGGARYIVISERDFSERVTLPATWLFCSGEHELEMVSELAAD
ncbi:MAG: hypothetical protein GEU71_05225 [Actinobacteria bacterium]|nr:hypothetical protein [Actinomycetota bacterium]